MGLTLDCSNPLERNGCDIANGRSVSANARFGEGRSQIAAPAMRLLRASVLRPHREFGVRAHVRYATGDPTPNSLAALGLLECTCQPTGVGEK